ncbi:MAG: hypothetical protein WED33_10690 [Bacteroidia bacterium]
MMKFIFFASLVFVNTSLLMAQKVNEKVEIESSGVRYAGKIIEINDEEKLYYVSYDGWGEISNEWVTLDRLKYTKATGKYKVGDRVEVEYGMVPEGATIIEVGENKYHIEYDTKSFGKRWVIEKQIKRL